MSWNLKRTLSRVMVVLLLLSLLPGGAPPPAQAAEPMDPFAGMYDSDSRFWEQAADLALSEELIPESGRAAADPLPASPDLQQFSPEGVTPVDSERERVPQECRSLNLDDLSQRAAAFSLPQAADKPPIIELQPSAMLQEAAPLYLDAAQLPQLIELYQSSRTDWSSIILVTISNSRKWE